MQALVQFRVNKSHKALYNLIEKLMVVEEKGYMAEQLRLRLNAFETLCDLTGEEDPIKVVSKLSAAWHLTHSHIEKNIVEISFADEEIDTDIFDLVDLGE